MWRPDTRAQALVQVPRPRSSTHCELAALHLVQATGADQIMTDSLCALQLISGWHTLTKARILQCQERAEVRCFLAMWKGVAQPPVLEKVKAHDETGLELRLPKTVGNDRSDRLAGLAVTYVTVLGQEHAQMRTPCDCEMRREHGWWPSRTRWCSAGGR